MIEFGECRERGTKKYLSIIRTTALYLQSNV